MRESGADGRAVELLRDLDRPDAWLLLVDGTSQSYVDLNDPTHLEFEYVRRLGHVVDLLAPGGAPLRALHLGGGAMTLPRYVAVTRPGSVQEVVELDGELVRQVRGTLPLPAPEALRIRVEDARAALADVAPGSMDLVVVDVFAGARVPAHLTSVEFVRAAARALRPGGTYAVNLADAAPLEFARAQAATVAAVFADPWVVVAPDVLRGRRFGNVLLVASGAGFPLDDLVRRTAGDPFPARVLAGPSFAAFVRDAVPTTDATATPSPVPPPGVFGRPA